MTDAQMIRNLADALDRTSGLVESLVAENQSLREENKRLLRELREADGLIEWEAMRA